MSMFREIGKRYGATKFQGDIYVGQTFESIYDDIFSAFRFHNPLKILEIGVQSGGSLKTWRDYFPYALIVGIDIDKKYMFKDERIETHLINQADEKGLKFLIDTYGYFDIVIDDGGHFSTQQIVTLKYLFQHTKLVYCIEDLDTAYPEIYPEFSPKGKTTIIDVLKLLVDSAVLGKADIERIDFRKRFCAIYKRK